MFTYTLGEYILRLMYTSLFDFLIITLFSICVWSAIKTTVFRTKFVYFILFLLLTGIWGVYASLDGFIFLLLMSEFLIILLFLITATSFNFISFSSRLPAGYFFVFYTLTILAYLWIVPGNVSTFFYSYHMVYSYYLEIVSSDLFIFFWGFFLEYSVSIFYITLILSLFSIFFIWSYFSIKFVAQKTKIASQTIELLRKQQPVKQTVYKSQVRIFKK